MEENKISLIFWLILSESKQIPTCFEFLTTNTIKTTIIIYFLEYL